MTGAIYSRFSPGVQREKSSTIEAQVAMCRQKAQAENVVIVEEHIYQDHNVSGGSMEREDFQRMIANIHVGDFPDILYVKDDKRLFRNVKGALSTTEEIWNHDVKIQYCLSDVGDPGNPMTIGSCKRNTRSLLKWSVVEKPRKPMRIKSKMPLAVIVMAGCHLMGIVKSRFKSRVQTAILNPSWFGK